MEGAPTTVVVRYALTQEARKMFARASGSLDPGDAPGLPTFPGLQFVPNKGDLVTWEVLGFEYQFVVFERALRFRSDGALELVLLLDVATKLD